MTEDEWDLILDLVKRGQDEGGAPADEEIDRVVQKFKYFVEEEKDSI
jgi:hypothetical protein